MFFRIKSLEKKGAFFAEDFFSKNRFSQLKKTTHNVQAPDSRVQPDSSASFSLKYTFAVMFYELSRKGRNNQSDQQTPKASSNLYSPLGDQAYTCHIVSSRPAPTVAYTTHAKAAKRTHAPRRGGLCRQQPSAPRVAHGGLFEKKGVG